MAWTLEVYSPTGGPHVSGSLIATYSNSSPGGIVEGFRWSCAPHGDCRQLEFQAVPKLVDIPPRAIVRLLVDDTPAFYGVVVRSGASGSGRAETYVAMGASFLLRQRYANYVYSGPAIDIAVIIQQIAGYFHPSIRYDSAKVSSTGYTLTSFAAPWVDLATVLKDLSAAAGGIPYGVDADGYFYFRTTPTLQSVRYQDANLRYLPVLGEEVYDRIRLVHPASKASYFYDAGLGYGSERVYLVPNMPDYMDRPPPQSWGVNGNWADLMMNPQTTIDLSYFYDDNPNTGYIAWNNPPSGIPCNSTPGFRGFFLAFSSIPPLPLIWHVDAYIFPLETPNYPQALSAQVRVSYTYSGNTYSQNYPVGWGRLEGTTTGWSNLKLEAGTVVRSTNCDAFRVAVRKFAVYSPGANLQRLAQSLVRTPYQSPTEVQIPGYLPPTTTLTLLGTPSGDISGPVAEWEYRYTAQEGLMTTARLGNRASDSGAEVIRILASDIAAEGDSRLRW